MQESLCEKWFLQHFYGYRCNVAGYRCYGLEDLEGIATTSEAHCFGFAVYKLRFSL